MKYENIDITLPEGKFNTKVQTFELVDVTSIYQQWVNLSDSLQNLGGRRVNLPEILSEAIFCVDFSGVRISQSINGANTRFDCYIPDTSSRIQVKACSVKDDLTSFGPKSVWDQLYFVHVFPNSKYNGSYQIYEIANDLIYTHAMNSKETFIEQQLQGRRPRMSLMKQIIKPNNIKPIIESNIYRGN